VDIEAARLALDGNVRIAELESVYEEELDGSVEPVDIADDGGEGEISSVGVQHDEDSELLPFQLIGYIPENLHERFRAK
jgi:hypothetical protein